MGEGSSLATSVEDTPPPPPPPPLSNDEADVGGIGARKKKWKGRVEGDVGKGAADGVAAGE